jgi:proteic killer suppression protein
MDVEFADKDLDRLEVDPTFNGDHSKAIVKAYRKRMQVIRAAADTRPFYAMKSLHFEKLAGDRAHQRSMRLNKGVRLIIELRDGERGPIARIVAIENYHP